MKLARRRDGAAPPQSHPTTTRLDARLRSLATLWYATAIALALIVTKLVDIPGLREGRELNAIIALGFVSAALLHFVPWQRFHRNLVLLHTLSSLGVIALLVENTGGYRSPFVAYYFMITVFSALYYGQMLAFLISCLVAMA